MFWANTPSWSQFPSSHCVEMRPCCAAVTGLEGSVKARLVSNIWHLLSSKCWNYRHIFLYMACSLKKIPTYKIRMFLAGKNWCFDTLTTEAFPVGHQRCPWGQLERPCFKYFVVLLSLPVLPCMEVYEVPIWYRPFITQILQKRTEYAAWGSAVW